MANVYIPVVVELGSLSEFENSVKQLIANEEIEVRERMLPFFISSNSTGRDIGVRRCWNSETQAKVNAIVERFHSLDAALAALDHTIKHTDYWPDEMKP